MTSDHHQFITQLRLAADATDTGQTLLQGDNDRLGLGFAGQAGDFYRQLIGFGIANVQGHGNLHVNTVV